MRRLNFFTGAARSTRPRGAMKAQRLDLRRKSVIAAAHSSQAEKTATVSRMKTEAKKLPRLGFEEGVCLLPGVKPEIDLRDFEQKEEKSDLRKIRGVGRRNEELLCSKGITSIESLASLFKEKFEEQDELLIKYLHKEVQIHHLQHCKSIADYLIRRKKTSKERITISVEGNISSGKTTFLGWIQEDDVEISDLCEVVEEPVEEWQCVGGNKDYNLLEKFYVDPKKYAYEFQNYVFLTRLNANRRTFEGEKPLRLLERSVFSDRMVFVRAVHEAKWMNDLELQLYDSWFNPFLKEVPGLIPDGFIYLRAEPGTCLNRMKKRARKEEVVVAEDYLQGLHVKHEDWFLPRDWKDPELLQPCSDLSRMKISPHPPTDQRLIEVPEELKGRIVWLKNSQILSLEPKLQNGSIPRVELPKEVRAAMSQVPALILNYDVDIDIKSDIEAKREYAKKVKLYFDFVKRCRRMQKIENPFYDWPSSEDLRRRWNLVDSFSEKELKEFTACKA